MLRFFILALAVVSLAACAGESIRSDKSSGLQVAPSTGAENESFTQRATRTRLGEIQLERVDDIRMTGTR